MSIREGSVKAKTYDWRCGTDSITGLEFLDVWENGNNVFCTEDPLLIEALRQALTPEKETVGWTVEYTSEPVAGLVATQSYRCTSREEAEAYAEKLGVHDWTRDCKIYRVVRRKK